MDTIGDGLSALAFAICVVGYLHITHRSRQRKLEIIHEERMSAMEKGLPIPEFPVDPPKQPDRTTLPLMAIVFTTLSLGTMIVLYATLPPATKNFCILPLPLTFLGLGFGIIHFLNIYPGK